MFFLSLGFIYLFFNLLNFYPVFRFLVTPLHVTRYCVTLFSNTPQIDLSFKERMGEAFLSALFS